MRKYKIKQCDLKDFVIYEKGWFFWYLRGNRHQTIVHAERQLSNIIRWDVEDDEELARIKLFKKRQWFYPPNIVGTTRIEDIR